VNEHAKLAVDGISLAAVVATFTAWLPPLAAFFSIVWTLIRIYETATVQRLLKAWRKSREAR
jgi:hypothetical protein